MGKLKRKTGGKHWDYRDIRLIVKTCRNYGYRLECEY